MNYKTNKIFTCKTYNDTLIIKQYVEAYSWTFGKRVVKGAWILFNGKEEYWNDGKISNFIENWC